MERLIGNICQKYSLLSATQPIDLVLVNDERVVPTLDKVVLASCALTNL